MTLAARRLPRSWLVMGLLAGVLIGLGAAHDNITYPSTLGSVALILSPIIWLRRPVSLVVAVTAGLSLGLWRGSYLNAQLAIYDQFAYQNVEITGPVADDPAYTTEGQLEFHVSQPRLDDLSLPGRVRVRGFVGALSIRRGDFIVASGKLYPGFGSRQGSLSFADIELIEHSTSWLESFRRRFFAGMYTALPEPQGSLGLGFLVGTRSLMPDELTEQLKRVGLTHIVAVSGYNLTILVRFARRAGSRFSKRLAALAAIGLVVSFLAVAGQSPSISRAAAVTAFALGAWYWGRRVSPVMLLLLSSAVTAMINPLYLWGDLGWWLSFLAFFGILIIAPLVRVRLFGERKLHWLPAICIETASAQLMTLPLIMAVFGELSLVALVANLMVLPLVPFAMLLSLVAGLAGMYLPLLAGWFAWPARLVLTFITETIALLSKPSWALVEQKLSLLSASLSYLAIILAALIAYRYLRARRKDVFAESVIE